MNDSYCKEILIALLMALLCTFALAQNSKAEIDKANHLSTGMEVKSGFTNPPSVLVTTLEGLRSLTNPDAGIAYFVTDYGRGQFFYDPLDHSSADNTGTIVVSTNGKRFKRIYDATQGMSIEWFGGIGDSLTDVRIPFEKALAALPSEGGTIRFPIGKFITSSSLGFFIGKSNVTIKGQGVNKTWLITTAQASGIQPSIYRSGGWLSDTSQMITYKDNSLALGQGWVELKNTNDTALLPVGTKFFINAGSSGYDPYYGEFNIVDKLVGNRIYLRYALARNYAVEAEAWNAKTSRAFIPPPPNATDTLTLIGQIPSLITRAISLNNELFYIKAVSGKRVTLYNPGNRNNENKMLPAGTKVTKWRAIVRTPQTSYNTTFEDFTIESKIGTPVVVSNSIKTALSRVEIIYNSFSGMWIDGDDGRDFRMDNCIVRTGDGKLAGSQFARSFCNISITNSTLTQVQFQYSEFNNSIDILHNNFFFHGGSGVGTLARMAPICAGWTCSNVRIQDNHIAASDCDAAISSSDVLNAKANSASAIDINHNTFDLNNVKVGITYNVFGGNLSIDHNTFSGSVGQLFNNNLSTYSISNLSITGNANYAYGVSSVISNNSFAGYINGFAKYNGNESYYNNLITRFGDTEAGNLTEINAHGNIIYSRVEMDTSLYRNFVFRDNTFIGWNFKPNSINIPLPHDNSVDVHNNRFIQQTGTFKVEKNFIFSL